MTKARPHTNQLRRVLFINHRLNETGETDNRKETVTSRTDHTSNALQKLKNVYFFSTLTYIKSCVKMGNWKGTHLSICQESF